MVIVSVSQFEIRFLWRRPILAAFIAGTLSIAAFPCDIGDNGSLPVIVELAFLVVVEDGSVQVPGDLYFDFGIQDGFRSSLRRVECQKRGRERSGWRSTDPHHCLYIMSLLSE